MVNVPKIFASVTASRGELIGSVVLVVIGIAFIALAPGKNAVKRVSAAGV